MPAVYYIGTYDIDNMEEFKNYPPKVAQLLVKYGAQVLASDVEAVTLEGKARTMNAIIKFPLWKLRWACITTRSTRNISGRSDFALPLIVPWCL